MNEFMDFFLVAADKTLYRHCRGFAACGLPKCPAPARRSIFGLGYLARLLFCDQRKPD
ncbi:MAG: hypothetical protein ACR2O4_09130 [Hyphomicrobiaceae bacterium]